MRTLPGKTLTLVLLVGGLLGVLLGEPERAAASELTGKPIGPPLEYLLPPQRTVRVDLEVLVDGRSVSLIPYQGRLYLPVAHWGTEYQLRVRNGGDRRIVALVSVDGLSVINGHPLLDDHSGYVVNPGERIVIKGWRRDRATVAAFTFEERAQSYAARRGYPDEIGVIRLLAIEEQAPRPMRPLEQSEKSSGLRRPTSDLGHTGTGWGRDLDSPIEYVSFLRSANRQSLTIYYDTMENLRRAGVPIEGRKPTPFPDNSDFCPPPLR